MLLQYCLTTRSTGGHGAHCYRGCRFSDKHAAISLKRPSSDHRNRGRSVMTCTVGFSSNHHVSPKQQEKRRHTRSSANTKFSPRASLAAELLFLCPVSHTRSHTETTRHRIVPIWRATSSQRVDRAPCFRVCGKVPCACGDTRERRYHRLGRLRAPRLWICFTLFASVSGRASGTGLSCWTWTSMTRRDLPHLAPAPCRHPMS